MSSDESKGDPLRGHDDEAAEREARRRAREERRQTRSEGARQSLGDRVSGALGGGAAGGEPESEPSVEPQPEPAGVNDPDPEPEPAGVYDPDLDQEPAGDYAPDHEPESDHQFNTDEFDAALQLDPDPDYDHDSPYDEDDDDEPVAGRSDYGRSVGGIASLGGGMAGVLSDPKMRVRLVAAAAVVLLLLAMLALLGGGGSEPEPVAAPVKEVKTISVSLPEGLTLEGMADVAKKAKLKGGYEKAAAKAMKKFNLKKYGAEDAPSLEGFLFPATYEVERKAPASDLVEKQLEAFEQNFDGINLKQAKKKNLTAYDVVTIASMIEREVSVPEERELVSAVIYNRLSAAEPLGIDATLRYELDNFTKPLLESELAADTPYNTRLNAGLPPTPIGNPGLASLEAAAEPAKSDFFFYVIKPGTCNEHTFTESSAEFEQAVAEYQSALEAKGGSPTEC